MLLQLYSVPEDRSHQTEEHIDRTTQQISGHEGRDEV